MWKNGPWGMPVIDQPPPEAVDLPLYSTLCGVTKGSTKERNNTPIKKTKKTKKMKWNIKLNDNAT